MSNNDTNKDAKISELENRLTNSMQERDFLISHHEEENKLFQEKIALLESENRIMTEKIIKKAKDLTNNESIDNIYKSGNTNTNNTVLNRTSVNIGESLNKSRVIGNNVIIGPVGSRVLTKKMLIEIIEDIYNSKTHFDKKCIESKMPKETMEQHMYTYLNQKYGLKNLIIEWATSIINGIRMFSPEDSDILLFGKILRNEIEEEARIVIDKLRTTINDLLVYFLRSKNTLKSNSEIKELAHSRMNSFLNEEEWKAILYYVYETEDAKSLDSRISEYIKRRYIDNTKIDNSKKLTREELQNLSKAKEDMKIAYGEFMKVYTYLINHYRYY